MRIMTDQSHYTLGFSYVDLVNRQGHNYALVRDEYNVTIQIPRFSLSSWHNLMTRE